MTLSIFPIPALLLTYLKGYLIAIIVVFGVILISAVPAGYMGYRWYKRPPAEYELKTSIKPEQLNEILKEWDENQNAGCEKEWKVIGMKKQIFQAIGFDIYICIKHISEETEKYIKDNSEKLKLAGSEPNNVNKNRYSDILPCKRFIDREMEQNRYF